MTVTCPATSEVKVDVTSERGSWLEASRENLSKQIGSDGRVLNFNLRYRELSGVTSLSVTDKSVEPLALLLAPG